MTTRTWVGRFCVVNGRVEEEGPWLGSLIRQRPDEEADELYVLVEPVGEGSKEYASQLVDVIATLYNREALSLTGALTRALRAAHDHLREWNRKSLPEHRAGAGATCLALRGTEAYLAQIGPSRAYALTASDGLRECTADQPDFEQSLGVQQEFEPRLTRVALEPGDLILVASSRLDQLASPELVRRILERGPDDALPELYLMCRDEQDMALVLLSAFEAEEQLPAFLSRDGEPPDAADATAQATPAIEATGDAVVVGHADAAVADDSEGRRVPAAVASVAAGTAGAFEPPRRPIHEEVREITASTAPPPPANVRLRGDAATPRYKRSTGSPLPTNVRVPKLALFAVLALIGAGLLAWWQLPRAVEANREERFATLLAGAREDNARAQATSDAAQKRALLTDAQAQLQDAAQIHNDNGELLALTADVSAALAELDAIDEVSALTEIVDVAQQVTGELSVTSTAVGGGNAYLLDAQEGRVLRVSLAGGEPPETILEQGEFAGVVTAGRPTEITWSEQAQALLVIDDQRQAFSYAPERAALPLLVRDAQNWGSGDAITTAGENLYVLDVQQSQVWRYLPSQGGFDSERTGLLDGADLTNATELAVGEDVYLLDSERGIRRFDGSSEVPFELAGIDRPMLQPASMSVLRGSNRIIVADRGNKRIIVASSEGRFLRQLVSPMFTDLRAVAIDEGTGTLYVLNGDTLLRAPFR
jgi:hypothetical protein